MITSRREGVCSLFFGHDRSYTTEPIESPTKRPNLLTVSVSPHDEMLLIHHPCPVNIDQEHVNLEYQVVVNIPVGIGAVAHSGCSCPANYSRSKPLSMLAA